MATEPKSVEAHLARVSFYLGERDIAEAEREFKVAAEIAPIGSPARMRLAQFYLLAQEPDDLLGMLYLARREPALAEGAFLKTIELEPRLIEPYVRLGNL